MECGSRWLNMAAAAAVNRPPAAHPGPHGGNLHSHASSGGPNPGQQDPGLHGTNQDPGPPTHPQHHVSARPVFYVPAPPPPPFLQYQWPMPFSYNPFGGFPGMGYGMVMPPFPPPPYMEAPAYILPHPHIQPVDYRRLLHPQVHAPSAPYQNPNQTRRVRPPYTVPVRETVNSAVQTEPTQRGRGGYGDGSPHVGSDSGHGTTSNSPSSSSSSSQKQGSAEVENSTLPSNDAKDTQSSVKHSFNTLHPAGTKTIQSCIRVAAKTQKCRKDSVGKENVPLYRNTHCNMWSVSSSGSMVPVCSSSQQEDEVVKERRVSVPDILMGWEGSTPQETILKMADKVLPQKDHQLPAYETEVENEESFYQSPTEPKSGPVVADSADAHDNAENLFSSQDSESLFKILKLPFALHELLSESRKENEPVGLVGSVRGRLPYRDESLCSLNKSHQLPDDGQENGNETNPPEDTPEIIPCQVSLNSSQMKRGMNESVWSVESLAPFIPTKESVLQKSLFEPEVIIEMTEEAENGQLSTQNDKLIVQSVKDRRQSRRFSSDSVLMSDSWLIYSTPAEKLTASEKPHMESEADASEMRRPKQSQNVTPLEKDPLVSPTRLPSKIILSTPTEEEVDRNRSSEPEANKSPNQECLIVNEQQEKSSGSPEHEETVLLNSTEEDKTSSTGQLILQEGADMEVEDGTCGNEEVGQPRNEQLCVPMADQRTQVSPSKGHLVDCGVQCSELQCPCEETKSSMGPNRRHPYKYPDMKKANGGKTEGFMNGHMQKNQKRHGQWKNRGQGLFEKPSSQQETYNGYYCKPGKSKGGNGRNPRY